jgi:hypothetical protein
MGIKGFELALRQAASEHHPHERVGEPLAELPVEIDDYRERLLDHRAVVDDGDRHLVGGSKLKCQQSLIMSSVLTCQA